MKRNRISIAICLIAVMVLSLSFVQKTSQAAEKVVKVTIKHKYTGSKQYAVIKGKSSSGNVVWSYKTAKRVATELDSCSMVVKGGNVFIIDTNTYIRLKKSSGKVLVKKKFGGSCAGPVIAVDGKKNLYAIGYYSNTLYKIKKNGTIIWKHRFSSNVYWAYKIIIKNGKVTVVFDQGGKKTVDADTGK